MTETSMKAMPDVNSVEGFNPSEFTRKLPNDDGTMSLYLDVKYRILWFRCCHPTGKIDSDILHVDEKSAVVCCKLYNDRNDSPDQYIAKATAQRFASDEKYGDRYLETAETAAMGRALAAAGYGTQFCGAADAFGNDIVDAPLDFNMMDDMEESGDVISAVQHETNSLPQSRQTIPPDPTQHVPQPVPQSAQPKAAPVTLEDYLNSMTLDEAKNVKITFGRNAGKTLGQLAMTNPRDLDWYCKNYSGRDLALKAGAILLVSAVTEKAG